MGSWLVTSMTCVGHSDIKPSYIRKVEKKLKKNKNKNKKCMFTKDMLGNEFVYL